jgi:type VI secretion system protein ImpF
MAGTATSPEARASLIDRLVDLEPKSGSEVRPLRTLSTEGLKSSVRRDLARLLNTRTSLPAHRFDTQELTVIDYGIPDFGAYWTTDENDQAFLADRIARSISTFEPRLQEVKVTVEPQRINEKTLRVNLEAVLVVESVREPVSFETVFQGRTGTWEVHERES